MGSVGDAYDNALCESFFATLECELIDRRRFRSQVEARMVVFDFIEGFYNPRRRHSALDYESPVEYERKYVEAARLKNQPVHENGVTQHSPSSCTKRGKYRRVSTWKPLAEYPNPLGRGELFRCEIEQTATILLFRDDRMLIPLTGDDVGIKA